MNYEFIIRSAVSLALLYSFFFAFLSRETFHRFNRVSLLLIMLASLVLPFVHLTVSQPTIVQEAMQLPTGYLADLPVIRIHPSFSGEGTGEGLLIWGQLLAYVYLAGVGMMVSILFVQTLSVLRQMRGGLRHTDDRGNAVILKPGIRSPFSIFRYIVMSVDDYEQHRLSILTHEQEHIRLHHSYDLLLLEAMKVLQWFNPFIWLLGHDLRAIHEYEADEAVINQGIDAKQYQQLLVLKAVGNRMQPFANTLGRGSLKQRIIMMYQKKSNRWKMLKALFVIPTMGFALYAFATPEVVPDVKTLLEREVSLPSLSEPTSMPDDQTQSTTADLASLMESESNFTVDYSEEKLDTFPVIALKPDAILIIDGIEVTLKELNSLKTEDIDNISVIKDEESRMQLLKDIILSNREVKAGDRIKGQVIESPSDGTPLSGVQVQQVTLEGKMVGATITDANGHFEMLVNDPQNKLVFTKDGYETVRSGIALDLHVGLTSTSYVNPNKAPQLAGGDKDFKEPSNESQ